MEACLEAGALQAFGGREVIDAWLKERQEEIVFVPFVGTHLVGKRSKDRGLAHFLHAHLHTQEGVWMLYWWGKTQHHMVGLVKFGKETEGPRKRVHGGALASVLDEVTGVTSGFFSGYTCVTRDLHIRYLKFVEVEAVIQFKAVVIEESETHLIADCELRSLDGGVLHCTARGHFKKYRLVQEVLRKQQMVMFEWDFANKKLSSPLHSSSPAAKL